MAISNTKVYDQSTLSQGSGEGLRQEDRECPEQAGPTAMGNSLHFL